MDADRIEEELIHNYKQDFENKTGKLIKIVPCKSKIEAKANFTDNAEFWVIVKAVFDFTGWTRSQTFTTSRSAESVFRRALIYYLAVNNGCTLTRCAQATGKDHTTVLHALTTFEARLESEIWYKKLFNEITTYVKENYYLYKRRYTNESMID